MRKKRRENETIYIKLETNIDDCTGEVLGYVMERLFEAGAKRRILFSNLYEEEPAGLSIECYLYRGKGFGTGKDDFKETTTIGIERQKIERAVLKPEIQTVQTFSGDSQGKSVRYRGR